MQSVTVCDLYATESEDYILVDHATEISDDDSYDYCEDLVSPKLPGQTAPTTCCGDSSHTPLPRELVFSVPSILMKDLDAAHAAAKLVQMTEPDHHNYESPDAGKSQEVTPAIVKNEPEHSANSVEKGKTEKRKEAEKEPVPKTPVTLSRSSNKKRRKKLKMVKKAQAVMNVADALSRPNEANTASPVSEKSLKQSQTATSRFRKVPNLAVACATETLAAYREELLKNRHACA